VFVADGEPVAGVEGLPDEDVSVDDEPDGEDFEVISDEDEPVEPDPEVPEPDDEVTGDAEPEVDVSDAPVAGAPASEVDEVPPEDTLTLVSVEFPSAHTPGAITTKRMTRMRRRPENFIIQHPSPEVS